MPITSLKFRPGINKETTSYSNKGGWNDCDLIRFRFGYPEKLGGWEKYTDTTFLGTSRSLHAWANLEGDKYLGIGTEIKFYIEESLSIKDITPIRRKVVNGVTIVDFDGDIVTAVVTGNVGTSAVGTVVIDNAQRIAVESEDPVDELKVVGTTAVGTPTIITNTTLVDIGMNTAVGNVTISITNEATVTVGIS
tara:strand:- start:3120 stop:3698 length:579 start_codon:yes stop_codon:yes gene_type:complete